jgi:hypothetical protein
MWSDLSYFYKMEKAFEKLMETKKSLQKGHFVTKSIYYYRNFVTKIY